MWWRGELLCDSENEIPEEEVDRRLDRGARAAGIKAKGLGQDYGGELPPLEPGWRRIASR